MIVDTGARTITVLWKHHMTGSKKWTRVEILAGKGPTALPIVVTKAHCNSKDCFSKNKGRKTALAAAMKLLSTSKFVDDLSNPEFGNQPLSREERVLVWGGYVKMRGGKI